MRMYLRKEGFDPETCFNELKLYYQEEEIKDMDSSLFVAVLMPWRSWCHPLMLLRTRRACPHH
jgi:hypothetical protein